MIRFCLAAAASALMLASCVGPGASPAPAPVRPATPRPAAPTPAPAAPTVDRHEGDWSFAPLSAGEWVHRRDGNASVALFGTAGGNAAAMLRCEAGQLLIGRAAGPAGASGLNLRTSFAERALTTRALNANVPMQVASLPATDPLFDQIIYSRGRFVIESQGQSPLIVPTRPEIARVIEDCRGS